jgi:hypothetical protein
LLALIAPASRRQPTMITVVSKIALMETIRVIVGQRFSFKKNIAGDTLAAPQHAEV